MYGNQKGESTLSNHEGPSPVIFCSTLSLTLSNCLFSLFQLTLMYPISLAICNKIIPPPTDTAITLPTLMHKKPLILISVRKNKMYQFKCEIKKIENNLPS